MIEINALLEARKAAIESRVSEPVNTIHSQNHSLAAEICRLANEPRCFPMYLGIIKRIGPIKAHAIITEIKRNRSDIKYVGRFFLYKAKK